jgi:hypothetical protein
MVIEGLDNMELENIEKDEISHKLAPFEESEDSVYDLAPFEESIKHAIATSEIKPGLDVAKVFGRQGLGEIASFGGATLAENAKRVDKVLQDAMPLQRIWNRSHTNWLWRHVNLTYHSPIQNIRQLAAEIQKKRGAINSAKWGQLKGEIAIRRMEERLQSSDLHPQKELELAMSLAQAKEAMADGMAYIEGAMKDVLELGDLHQQMIDMHGPITETMVEEEETKTHLKRSLVQCLRDVRQTGTISKGEQEYLEQIGANVSKVQAEMQKYAVWEKSDDAPWDSSGLFTFIDELTEILIKANVAEKRMEHLGLEEKVNVENTYTYNVGDHMISDKTGSEEDGL